MAMNRNFMYLGGRVLALCLLMFYLSGCSKAATPPFYKAQKGDLTVYVLGTLHIGKEDDYPLSDNIDQALRESRLVMELNNEQMQRIPTLVVGYQCSNPCLKQYMTDMQWRQQEKRFGKQISRMPPWQFMYMVIFEDYAANGLFPSAGTEAWLHQRYTKLAATNGPEIGLETAEEQLALLASPNKNMQKIMLQSYLTSQQAEIKQIGEQLYQYWRNGDSNGALTYSLQLQFADKRYAKESAQFNEAMITRRNQLFVERLQPLLKPGKPVFLAVGILHLGGPRGVIELLRQQGFTVEKQ